MAKPLKILMIGDYAPPLGGAEIMMLSLRDQLRDRGHDVRLFASRAGSAPGDSHAEYYCFGTTRSARTALQVANPWAYRALRRVLAEFRPDVVHVKMFLTQLSPLILPLLRDVPTLHHVVWYRPICPTGTKTLPDETPCEEPYGNACRRNGCLSLRAWGPLMFQMRLYQRWRDVFDLVVANSHAVKQMLGYYGIDEVEVVWNGVPVPPGPGPMSSVPTVVFASRLVRGKGGDVLLKSFSRVARAVPDARLIVAGDGSERERLESMVAELGLSSGVSMIGHVSREEMEKQFAGAWVQAVPSVWAEPFGIVATEAMMHGRAVVASGSGGLAEIVRDGETGYQVPPGNVDSLSDALSRLLQNRDLAEKMGRMGRQVATAEFSDTVFADRFLQLYYRLTGVQE
jgi:glycosyltransferase involved in cell wall biosynthesis